MAQAGYTPILIYASGTATNIPTAGNLISGSSGAELAINYADGKLYYKDSSGNVKLLSIGYGSSSVTPTNGGVQYGTGTALALTAAGSSGQILRSNGAAAPTWADLSTLGVNTISFGTTGLTPNSATAGAVTVAGTLVTANGGTGLGGATPFTANGVLYASSASALTSGSALTFDGTEFKVNAASGNVLVQPSNVANAKLYMRHGSIGNNNGFEVDVSSNTIFLQAGSEAMRLTSTSLYTASGINVGIGTSSPAYKLDVSTASASNFIRTGVTGSNSGAGVIFQGAISGQKNWVIANQYNVNGGLEFTQTTANGGSTIGATPSMVLDSSGNLGLGVTPSAWYASGSGWKALQVGAFGILSNTATNDSRLMSNAYLNTGGSYIYLNSSQYATNYIQISGQHQWFTAASGTAGNAITFTQALTLTANRNLLVGTTTENNGNGGLKVNGQFAIATSQAFTASGTVNDTAYYVVCYALSATCTLTLPTPANNTGRLLNIVVQSNQQVVSASSNVTAITNGSLTTSILPATAGKWAQLWCDGTYWNIIATNV